ncbi:hypothetical protein [Burkholderia diffusa]|uniref:hypothetical protein n=1 Tax=Burkholderia diffusa TaxID=488732 RepID=UPI00157A5D08|nr:hypothetical protein [Burkholderia diffusa]
MANKRQRPSGTWEYTIKRAKLLPKPLSLTFDTEEEGDAYVARLEQLLDAGIVPDEVVEQRDAIATQSRRRATPFGRIADGTNSGTSGSSIARNSLLIFLLDTPRALWFAESVVQLC